VFASSAVGFRFCLAGDREGEVLIGHDLLRELAAIEGSGFDATSQLDLCLIGDNGAQASILCQGTDASFTRALEFSDRARLVRSPKTHPFPLPTCGSGAMQSAFVIPLLAILGRRGRPRG
jgi:hypothetical protein